MRLRPLAIAGLVLWLGGAGVGHAAPAPGRPDPADEALRRVLRSGCREGLPEVRALIGHGAAPWAETVTRLCGEIGAAQPAAAPEARGGNGGRGVMVVYGTLYGIWLGIASDVLFTVDGTRSAIVPPLLGMAAGLGLSVVFTGDHPLDSGQAWTIITGLDYGSLNGALWAGGLDLQATGVVGTALATGLVGGGVGLLVASKVHPRQGHVELVRSGLLWGTAGGLLGMAAVSTDGSSQSYLRGAGVAMDLGFLGGLALAVSFDLSRNRVLVIDAGAVGGGLAGMGIAWLVVAGPGASPRAIFASGLGGMCTGLAAAAYLSRHMDARDAAAGPDTAALLGRDARGRWAWGTPGPVPVLDRFSQRVVGATFTALAGAF